MESNLKASYLFLDRLFSFFVFLAILLLAAYMFMRIGISAAYFFRGITEGYLLSHDAMDAFSPRALHSIAEVIILIKAYRILISYVNTQHVSVEYIVEISIIASAIELLFAMDSHDVWNKLVLGVFGLCNLYLYLRYFHVEHDKQLHKRMGR